ncbi:MAG: VWA domain-containing protein [Acidobacteria bacterium]|nr:VWA domain-containing protein [Acidobacteriota bacterium]
MNRLAAPEWLFALVPVALWCVVAFHARRRGIAAFRISSLGLAGERRGILVRFAWLPSLLGVVGLALIAFALARPQRIFTFSTERRGIDIVVALDASGSMGAEDFRPRNRFSVAKQLIARFVEKRVDDRIGIVTFGARAATRVPVSFDHRIVIAALERCDLGDHGDGTAIGHALATAVNRLRTSRAKSRVIILLTDGINNAGSVDPATAAELAKTLGIRIYAIGVGSRGIVQMPVRVQNRLTGDVETIYRPMRADIDEAMLTSIAGSTGGAYFRATDEQALESIFARIDEMERTSLEAPKTTSIDELYQAPLAAGLALIAIALLAGETIWMRLAA